MIESWRGYAVAPLVGALRYVQAGRKCVRFPIMLLGFSFTQSFQPHYGFGVDSASNRNDYHVSFLRAKGGQCVGLTTLPLSRADCLEIWELQTTGTLKDYPPQCRNCFTLTCQVKCQVNATVTGKGC
jgi:hypothetical protein